MKYSAWFLSLWVLLVGVFSHLRLVDAGEYLVPRHSANVQQSANSHSQPQTLERKLLAEGIPTLAVAAQSQGDPTRGAWAYYRSEANCSKCHEPTGNQRRLGPDLTQQRETTITEIIESILLPSAKIREGYETCLVVMDDGQQFQGIIADSNDQFLSLDRIEEIGKPLQLSIEEIEQRRNLNLSSMPVGLVNAIGDRGTFLDLIRFLEEAAKQGPTRVAQLRPIGATDPGPPVPAYEATLDHRGLIENWDAETLTQGSEIYRLRCASCHGDLSNEGSMPTSLRFAQGQFKRGFDPLSMYQTLTHGFGMMNDQRWMVPEQKYAVIHYIRETFLRPHNPTQYQSLTPDYLAQLPVGITRGPRPVASEPWSAMNYGPVLFNTLAVTNDTSNIAQKGIIVRLDSGPGGVESGSHWILYEHDTMRVAATWRGNFIDYNGIHFNGVHGQHPRIAGEVLWQNSDRAGWARPQTGSFAEERLRGRDGRPYGPLPADWIKYLGHYRFGNQAIFEYTVGETICREMPGLSFVAEHPVVSRYLEIGPRQHDLILQVAEKAKRWQVQRDGVIGWNSQARGADAGSSEPLSNGTGWYQLENGDDWNTFDQDFTITAKIQTERDGTIWSKTRDQQNWVPQGQSLFIRDGRLTFDIGWVGAVQSHIVVADNQPHAIAITWHAAEHRVEFFVDGKSAGQGLLRAKQALTDSVIRLGFTNENFPTASAFAGQLSEFCFFPRRLDASELQQPSKSLRQSAVCYWPQFTKDLVANQAKQSTEQIAHLVSSGAITEQVSGWYARARFSDDRDTSALWIKQANGDLQLRIPAGDSPVRLELAIATLDRPNDLEPLELPWQSQWGNAALPELQPLTVGGPTMWPETYTTEMELGDELQPFAVDVINHPTLDQSGCRMRMTGLDFLPDSQHTMLVSTWDGNIWSVSNAAGSTQSGPVVWRRIASGLFQPLGIKYRDGIIFVTCRDQLVALHDRNRDGEIDWYQCFNSDHQVTEHFHEFAMGLQTDAEGNFYYAKSARHALKAVVPHHGTLLKIAADGSKTEIVATGFRAANGVCVNPDGTFIVTDQEGHWTPKNRINWVVPGGFYGNLWGYHNITDASDSAMQAPLCWITNAMDRSPAELLWIDCPQWGALHGALLCFSYGYGRIFVVPHEATESGYQGGICELPIPAFATGIMRGRFDPSSGHLFGCGMFAWSSTQEQPGGLYRIRRTAQPVHLPIELRCHVATIEIEFSEAWDRESALDIGNYRLTAWSLKRSEQYGSEHHDEHALEITSAELLPDNRTIRLTVPELHPSHGLELIAVLKTVDGKTITRKIHHTINHLPGTSEPRDK